MATPPAETKASISTARPFADSQPKNAEPQWMPPNISRCTRSRARASARLIGFRPAGSADEVDLAEAGSTGLAAGDAEVTGALWPC